MSNQVLGNFRVVYWFLANTYRRSTSVSAGTLKEKKHATKGLMKGPKKAAFSWKMPANGFELRFLCD